MNEAATREGLEHKGSGKVRELYELGDQLLLVASDRISAYDVVLPDPIPDKGKVLTGLSSYWFSKTLDIVPNHLVTTRIDEMPGEVKAHAGYLQGRTMLCRKLEIVPVECVVRGYLSGSGWREYRQSGAVCGIGLPEGLEQSQKLPEPIFTPATKAAAGAHDENIDAETAVEIIGSPEIFQACKEISLKLYQYGASHAVEHGIILADTKFEFGLDGEGAIVLADELFTPDSSRFWPAGIYRSGAPQPSFDKQYVRDWLDQSGWDHSPPAPSLPRDVIENTHAKYVQAYEQITGEPFSNWLVQS